MFPTSPETWEEPRLDSLSSAVTGMTVACTGVNVPPSRRIRAAQKIKLIEKTHISFKDVQRQCKDLVKTFEEMELKFKAFSETAEDMAKQFGALGHASHEHLRASSAALHSAAAQSSADTTQIFGRVAEYCDSVRSCEPAYRKAHKKQVRASEKYDRSIQNPKLSAAKAKKLRNDQVYAQINSDFARTTYEDSRFHMALVLLDGVLKQSLQVVAAFGGAHENDREGPAGDAGDAGAGPTNTSVFASFSGCTATQLGATPFDPIGKTLMLELADQEAPLPRVLGLNVRADACTDAAPAPTALPDVSDAHAWDSI